MCSLCAPVKSDPATLLLHDMRGVESRLTNLTVARRRQRIVAQIVPRITQDLRYVLRRERERVLDLLAQTTVRYTGRLHEAQVYEVDTLMRLLLNGVDVNQYQAVLEDGYRAVMPKAIDATLEQVLDAAGIKYRAGPAGDLFLSNGIKLVRFRGAENWVRDHAIQFSRTWAGKISDRTNTAIRNTLADGMAQFEDMQALRARVHAVYMDVSGQRAETIARTEVNRGYNAAFQETGQRLGVTEKYWIPSGSPYADIDVCGENAEMGNVKMFEKFKDVKGDPIDAPPAHPNCFLHHSVVIVTEEGLKQIHTIRPGDKVLTHRGRYRPVLAVSSDTAQYYGPAVRIHFRGNGTARNPCAILRNSVTTTPEHPFLTKRGWVEAKRLTTNDRLYVEAQECSVCGKQTPYWRKSCSRQCHEKLIFTDETKQKIRRAKTGSGNAMFRKRPWNFIDGIKPKYGYVKPLRRMARERDGNRCRICGMTNVEHQERYGCSLDTHHINPLRYGGRNTLDNLTTLCRQCHANVENTSRFRILKTGGAQFIDVPILKVEHLERFHGEKRYNLEVAEDHSYVAKGVVTHNCLCSLGLDVQDNYQLPQEFMEVG